MPGQTDSDIAELNSELSHDILAELEGQTSDEIRKRRVHERIVIKATVILRPGNSSAQLDLKMQGVTGDVSKGGCSAMYPLPVQVGDIYRLEFDASQLDVPIVFARCLRCRMVREDAFEANFKFFSPITLPADSTAREDTPLV